LCDLPLHGGQVQKWLADRMTKVSPSRANSIAVSSCLRGATELTFSRNSCSAPAAPKSRICANTGDLFNGRSPAVANNHKMFLSFKFMPTDIKGDAIRGRDWFRNRSKARDVLARHLMEARNME
jgi:hypothetical protein